jgi:hypothetical protein
MLLLQVRGNTDRSHVLTPHGRELRRVHLVHRHAHGHPVLRVHSSIHTCRQHGLALLLQSQLLLLLHLGGERGVSLIYGHLVLELELLVGVEVLQSMRLRVLGLHAAHEGGRVGLTARRRHHTVAGHLRRHTRLGSRLARVMSHAGGHGVPWVYAWMLLHSGMEAATRSHTGHHGPYLQCLVVDYPPTWIPTPRPPRYFIKQSNGMVCKALGGRGR